MSQLVCHICMHVTFVPMDFLLALCWTCHATYFEMWTRGYKNWSRIEKGKIFYPWQFVLCINYFSGNLIVWTCLLHMYTRYIRNNVFLCSIMWGRSCYIFQDGNERTQTNDVGVQKVRCFTLDNCFVYKIFFLVISFFVLVCYSCTHVTYVIMYFCVASCWTCHATHIIMCDQRMQK